MPLWDGRETPDEYAERKQRNAERAAEYEERQRAFEEKQRLWQEGERTREYNRGRMVWLAHEARNLYYVSDFYSARAHQAMRDLQASAKDHRYVGRDHNHLNDDFWNASKDFYNKRDGYFLDRKRDFDQQRISMSLIADNIERLACITLNVKSKDFKERHDEIERLTNDLKKLRCAKEDSNEIWTRVKNVKNEFHKAWKDFTAKETEARKLWNAARETARDVRGRVIGEYKIGEKGYTQRTVNDGNSIGSTTGHINHPKGQDLHHHGSHSHSSKNAGHYSKSSDIASGTVIDNFTKK